MVVVVWIVHWVVVYVMMVQHVLNVYLPMHLILIHVIYVPNTSMDVLYVIPYLHVVCA